MAKIAQLADKKAEKEAAYQKDIVKSLQLMELTVTANKDKSKADELRRFVIDNPDMIEHKRMLADDTKLSLLKAVMPDEGFRILAEKELDVMQKNLSKGNASPIEQLM